MIGTTQACREWAARRVVLVACACQFIALAGQVWAADPVADAIELRSLRMQQHQDESRLQLAPGGHAGRQPRLDLQNPRESQQVEHEQRARQLLLDQQQWELHDLQQRQQLRLRSALSRDLSAQAERRQLARERQQQLQQFGRARAQSHDPSGSPRLNAGSLR